MSCIRPSCPPFVLRQQWTDVYIIVQTPGPPFIPDEVGKGVKGRIIFVQHGATMSSEDNLLMGKKDEDMTTLGEMQATKVAELIMDLKVCWFLPQI